MNNLTCPNLYTSVNSFHLSHWAQTTFVIKVSLFKKQWCQPKFLRGSSMGHWWGICPSVFTMWYSVFIVNKVSEKIVTGEPWWCFLSERREDATIKKLKNCQKHLTCAIQGVKHVTVPPLPQPHLNANFWQRQKITLASKILEDHYMESLQKTSSSNRISPLSSPQN